MVSQLPQNLPVLYNPLKLLNVNHPHFVHKKIQVQVLSNKTQLYYLTNQRRKK
jgi:hypothetical protein